jgi:hypothetical protein
MRYKRRKKVRPEEKAHRDKTCRRRAKRRQWDYIKQISRRGALLTPIRQGPEEDQKVGKDDGEEWVDPFAEPETAVVGPESEAEKFEGEDPDKPTIRVFGEVWPPPSRDVVVLARDDSGQMRPTAEYYNLNPHDENEVGLIKSEDGSFEREIGEQIGKHTCDLNTSVSTMRSMIRQKIKPGMLINWAYVEVIATETAKSVINADKTSDLFGLMNAMRASYEDHIHESIDRFVKEMYNEWGETVRGYEYVHVTKGRLCGSGSGPYIGYDRLVRAQDDPKLLPYYCPICKPCQRELERMGQAGIMICQQCDQTYGASFMFDDTYCDTCADIRGLKTVPLPLNMTQLRREESMLVLMRTLFATGYADMPQRFVAYHFDFGGKQYSLGLALRGALSQQVEYILLGPESPEDVIFVGRDFKPPTMLTDKLGVDAVKHLLEFLDHEPNWMKECDPLGERQSTFFRSEMYDDTGAGPLLIVWANSLDSNTEVNDDPEAGV